MAWLGFLLGLWTGAIFTALAIAICQSAKEADEAIEREAVRGSDPL
ncbi:MAG TPA: hypothetical protein VFC10_07305 [Terriglobia bacterium]|jgi:hypothetical protein|nr:hypothetical protein [Terracidiphilus sp.]HZT69540.1 hypothetical protein [Terriglobia bacterium]